MLKDFRVKHHGICHLFSNVAAKKKKKSKGIDGWQVDGWGDGWMDGQVDGWVGG